MNSVLGRVCMPGMLPLILCLCAILAGCSAAEPPAESDAPTLDSVTSSSEYLPGFIDAYRDRDSGELYLVVEPEQLDRDILHFASFLDGNAFTGTQRGVFADESVLRLHRDYKRLEFRKINTAYYFDPDSALSRARDANLLPSVLAVAEILDEDEQGRLLIAANPVFLSEALLQIKRAEDPEAEPAFGLGEFSETRSSLLDVGNYPRNTDIAVSYVYEDPQPEVEGGRTLSDSRYVTVQVQHSLVEAPDDGFQPRTEDARVGYFTKQVTDMTSLDATPWRDPITRWRLEKKDPEAALSEPVKPIVFWLENTTPEIWRDTVRDAVLVWNQAFEAAGFLNAIEVRQQPDDADWEASDLRYNVLRWTSSEESPWGGYGPNFADPRTGEILGADIMLEYSWIRIFAERTGLYAPGSRGRSRDMCALGSHLKTQLALGRARLLGAGRADAESELVRQSLYDLVTHEVGHSLGLSHNFRASQLLTTAELSRASTDTDAPLIGSIMEYPTINLPDDDVESPRYFLTAPGPYDVWAIQFGYTPALADAEAEQARQTALLARSTEPELAFGLDSDALTTTTGVDPRVQRFDMARDPLVFAATRLRLLDQISAQLLAQYDRPGESWQALYDAYNSLHSERFRQLRAASRWIGGVYVDRAVQGQTGAGQPLSAVPEAMQRSAMALLSANLFAPGALTFDEALLRHLQQQRRGYQYDLRQDPQLHQQALRLQQTVLEQLLHPITLARINNSALYGNSYTLDKVLYDLRVAVFEADMQGSVDSIRQQLQREFVEQLLPVADPRLGSEHDHVSRGQAWYTLEQIADRLRQALDSDSATDAASRAHRLALLRRIETGLAPSA
ncbi:MAG: zinc-dependent metalloprotease [Halieaceae bacterium]|nr:zinc-dependent metalloprotease [Halieaceae bacterium]